MGTDLLILLIQLNWVVTKLLFGICSIVIEQSHSFSSYDEYTSSLNAAPGLECLLGLKLTLDPQVELIYTIHH